jgi:hypothetical protein
VNIYEAIGVVQEEMIETEELGEAIHPVKVLNFCNRKPRDAEGENTRKVCREIVRRAEILLQREALAIEATCLFISRVTLREISPLARFRRGICA